MKPTFVKEGICCSADVKFLNEQNKENILLQNNWYGIV
jgi:hypothetical protein